MARGKETTDKMASTGANLGFDANLWQAADALCNNIVSRPKQHPRSQLTSILTLQRRSNKWPRS